MVRVTVLDRDDSGEQTEKVSLLRRSEVTALEAQRQSALSGKRAAENKEGENIGAAQQKLSVQANATNCFATGLLIYSGLNRSGAILCLRTAGHEASGTAGFSLAADWQYQNGGKYPASFWAGADGGRFHSYFNVFSFAPWTLNQGTPAVEAVQNANYVGMDRVLNAPATDPSIAVPANYPLVQKMAARGHQIYVCKDLGAGSFAWTLSAPSALSSASPRQGSSPASIRCRSTPWRCSTRVDPWSGISRTKSDRRRSTTWACSSRPSSARALIASPRRPSRHGTPALRSPIT